MRRAHAGQAPRHDLAALGHELAQQPVVLVVDVFNFLGAELANFLAPEKLAPACAALARRPARSATAAAISRTISPRPSAFTRSRPFGRCRRLLWCFRLVSHNAPSSQWPVTSDQWPVKSFAPQMLVTGH